VYASKDLSGYQLWIHPESVMLSGGELPELRIAYETWGVLNGRHDNAILLHCGMSASSHAKSHPDNQSKGWWEDFIGPGKALDTSIFFVICTNNLGGCYGSSGPGTIDPRTGKAFGSQFPRFTVQDMVDVQFQLLDHLGIDVLHASVGASLGGMHSICAAGRYPERVKKIVSISACARSFPGSIAFRHAQRQAVMSDPKWNKGDYYDGELPADGLRLARQIGTITYRSGKEWVQRFGQNRRDIANPDQNPMINELEMEHYLQAQGEKWVGQYDANSLLWISKAMDAFTMEARDEKGVPRLTEGLRNAMMPALIVGVQVDALFPVSQQQEIAISLRKAGNRAVVYYELDTIFGHDAFLLDEVAIGPAVKGHLEHEPSGAAHLWKDLASTASSVVQAMAGRQGHAADSMRDVFRALAQGDGEVEVDRLRAMVKLIWGQRLTEANIDKVFENNFDTPMVKLDSFLAIREDLEQAVAATETYLM